MFKLSSQLWCDQSVLSVHRLPERAWFLTASDDAHALAGEFDRAALLSGEWDFYYTEFTPLDERAFMAALDMLEWGTIRVPRSWQTAGYGKALYTDEDFPFPIRPPYVPAQNPTGVYRRRFSVPRLDEELILRFDGVESCASVYVNGQYAGYTQGSRLPSEFLITSLCHEGENELMVIVREYCDGVYLEDQDMWWLGGIIRDVWLLTRPARRIEDVAIVADYDEATGMGMLRADCAGAEATFTLLDGEEAMLEGRAGETYALPVAPWNAEEPRLYRLLLRAAGESAVFQIGFRRVEIAEGELRVNGRRIFLRGVNRHEFSPIYGRTVTRESTREDLLLMKKAHINAVRTSHYPDNPFFYELCNELGFYVVDECDLETHGFEIEGDPDRLANDPAWTEAYLDRARRTFARDKNQPCVIMWSLGNEAFRGENFGAMYRYFHEVDTRPVHYEGDVSYAWSDVHSTMYTSVGRMFELDACGQDKPMLLCEFAHAMGNGPGSLREYREVMERSKHIQGYFIWEWRNHGLLRDGRYLNGGDTGTAYHSGNFCMDGLLNSDGTPTPGFDGYAKMNEPLRLSLEGGSVRVGSMLDFRTVYGASLTLTLRRDDWTFETRALPIPPVAPNGAVSVALPEALCACAENALYTLECEATEDGRTLGRERFILREYAPVSAHASTAKWVRRGDAYCVESGLARFAVSLLDGRIHGYSVGGEEVMPLGPQLSFYRPAMDNDKRSRAVWNDLHLHAMTPAIDEAWLEGDTLWLRGDMGANARLWSSPFTMSYTPYEDGSVRVALKGRFTGSFGRGRADRLPRIGTDSVMSSALEQFSYLGYGPGETYCDSRFQAGYGWFASPVRETAFRYDCPQESGNRTGCRAVALTDGEGRGVAMISLAPCDACASRYDAADIDRAAHPDELRERDHVNLRFDYKEAGLGSGSCGPEPLDPYTVRPLPYEMQWIIAPLAGGALIDTAKKAWNELC